MVGRRVLTDVNDVLECDDGERDCVIGEEGLSEVVDWLRFTLSMVRHMHWITVWMNVDNNTIVEMTVRKCTTTVLLSSNVM